jgi:hypothetical protein
VVVEAEFNGTTKTTLRSERRSALKKGRKAQKERKKEEKRLDTVGIVRDVRER